MAEFEITQAGLDKLQKELVDLKTNKRPVVIKRIKEARELGDLSENADYQDAREEQSFIEGRIKELESKIKDAKVVTGKSSGLVAMGSRVTVSIDGTQMQFEVVGASEADPSNGSISNESPIGKALLGHSAGEKIGVQTPDGIAEYEILKVE